MFKLHSNRSRHESDLSPRRSGRRARLLGAGIAMTVGATGVGAYTSGVAFASPSNESTIATRQGAPQDYAVTLRVQKNQTSTATLIPEGGPSCARDEFRGTVGRSTGTFTDIRAFTAVTSGWCGVPWPIGKPSVVAWDVTMDGSKGWVGVYQAGPRLYVATCGGGIGCTETPGPRVLPWIAIWAK
jgi:hypothetical protein